MSIQGIETNPVDKDRVHMADPGTDAVAEPDEGTDVVPTADAITHMHGHGRTRDVRNHPDYVFQERAERDVFSGTEHAPERWIHDEALQVRELVPTQWDTTPVTVSSAVAVQLLAGKNERKLLTVKNRGPGVAYIGPTQVKASPVAGFPLGVNESVTFENLSSMWCSVDTSGGATTADVRVLETWRTDNRGN